MVTDWEGAADLTLFPNIREISFPVNNSLADTNLPGHHCQQVTQIWKNTINKNKMLVLCDESNNYLCIVCEEGWQEMLYCSSSMGSEAVYCTLHILIVC